jgi:para-aminobenzoate synthetase/4-amino-4-deoxychorismate lyase
MKEDRVILHDAAAGRWLCFEKPFRIITTRMLREVPNALNEIETLVNKRRWHAAGFISYEAATAFDPALCTRPSGSFPLIWFGLYGKPEEIQLPAPDFGAYSLGDAVPSVNPSEYGRAIRRIKKHIHSGDTYQVNYTIRLRIPFRGDPWNLFLAMVRAQSPGYSAWVGAGRNVICSSSPELFFRLDGERLTCKPMKGTVRRGRTLGEDRALSRWLYESEKNRAENLMIVDMVRNDLGRVAEIGSVHVPRLFEVERHPTLWQMTSTVEAHCSSSVEEILTALFPCASITGAPKIRTTRIISEIETAPRGIYTGCIGFLSPDRNAQFNIAIRTAVVDLRAGYAEYGAGGGIVHDSDCEDEYAEALLKSRVLTQESFEFSLLETLRWSPEEGYFLLDRHLNRIADSAEYFDYPIDRENIELQLRESVRSYGQKPQRVRLLVARDGVFSIEPSPLNEADSVRPLRVKLARRPVNSADVFLYHKTTFRRVYEEARNAHPGFDDILLYNERNELTESCVANIVLEINGEFFTPPVEAGLLAGTYRADLLEQGRIQEKTLLISDLKKCSGIFLVNSVRKWMKALWTQDP